jgi:hypothetical protein
MLPNIGAMDRHLLQLQTPLDSQMANMAALYAAA